MSSFSSLSELLSEALGSPVTIQAMQDRAAYIITFQDYTKRRELEIERAMERAYEANR